MSRVKSIFQYIWNLPYMKYVVVSLVGVVLVVFVGDNSIAAHLRNKQHINELEKDIRKYEAQYSQELKQIRNLDHNPKAIEKIARERYFMKADDEDIFVLSDDDRTYKTELTDDEAAK